MTEENTNSTPPKELSKREIAIGLIKGVFAERVASLPDEVLLMGERELENHFRPKPYDFLIRKRIWQLATTASKTGIDRIETAELYDGIIQRNLFYYCLKSKHRLAWYLVPITDHADLIEEGFYYTLKKVRDEVLDMPVTERSAPVIMKALQFFADRHLGPMLHRMDINQKNLNLNIEGTPAMQEALSADSLDDKFKALESKMRDVRPVAVSVDEDDN